MCHCIPDLCREWGETVREDAGVSYVKFSFMHV